MIVEARSGNTANGMRAYTDKGALAHFLEGIGVGETKKLDKFVRMDLEIEDVKILQMKVAIAKPKGSVIRTKSEGNSLIVTRIA